MTAAGTGGNPLLRTTPQAFGDKLHTYTIVDAINDGNVLPFRIDFINTIKQKDDILDKSVRAIDKAINSSIELRSKKELINGFVSRVNVSKSVDDDWRHFIQERKEEDILALITAEKLKEEEARRFIDISFRDGILKTTGTDIDKILPPVSRFGGVNRTEKKQGIIDKLIIFFEKYLGLA